MDDQEFSTHCGNCRFWDSLGPIPGDERGEQRGNCRRHAPVLVMIGTLQQSRFPVTNELHWCGDWENGIGQ